MLSDLVIPSFWFGFIVGVLLVVLAVVVLAIWVTYFDSKKKKQPVS